MKDCIFCKIISKELKSDIVFEDDKFIAFKDINPQAPVHVLVVPKKHVGSLNDINVENQTFIEGIFSVIKDISVKLGINKGGYRVVVNTGRQAGQMVEHIHFHILSGRELKWPPG